MERYIIRATLKNGTELYLAEHNVLLWTLDVDDEQILFCTKRQANKFKNNFSSDRFYSSFAGKAIKTIDVIKVNDSYIVRTYIVQQP